MSQQKPFAAITPSNRKHEIIKMLEEKGVSFDSCSRCHETNVHIYDLNDFSELVMRGSIKTSPVDAPSYTYRVFSVTCQLCGLRSEFDLDVLERS